jgi:hypothetical protein
MKIDAPKPSSLRKESPPPYENLNDLSAPPQSYNNHSTRRNDFSAERFDVDVESAPPKSNIIPPGAPRRSAAHGKKSCWFLDTFSSAFDELAMDLLFTLQRGSIHQKELYTLRKFRLPTKCAIRNILLLLIAKPTASAPLSASSKFRVSWQDCISRQVGL